MVEDYSAFRLDARLNRHTQALLRRYHPQPVAALNSSLFGGPALTPALQALHRALRAPTPPLCGERVVLVALPHEYLLDAYAGTQCAVCTRGAALWATTNPLVARAVLNRAGGGTLLVLTLPAAARALVAERAQTVILPADFSLVATCVRPTFWPAEHIVMAQGRLIVEE